VALFVALLSASCNPTKKLLPGQYLLQNVEVKNVKETRITESEYETYFRQKPNRKFLRTVPFFVWWYNQFDNETIKKKKVERNLDYDRRNANKVRKFERKNIKRAKKGKKPRLPKLKDKESPTFLESLRDIGEPAVVLDSFAMAQTRFQLTKLLFSRGYFNNLVTDTVRLDHKRKRAYVTYHLYPGPRYRMSQITYDIEDDGLREIVMADTANSLLKKSRSYNAERIQRERQRITDLARNHGYYYFDNAYVDFQVDSTIAGDVVSIEVHIEKFTVPPVSSEDSLVQVNHTKYTIDNVYIITEPVIGNLREASFTDTLRSNKKGIIYLLNKPLPYRQFVITDNVDIYKGQVFNKDSAQQTYKQLTGLGIFRNVVINFLPSRDYRNRLDCYILCAPLPRQSITSESEGINSSGYLGVDSRLIYQNRNLLRAGELLEFSVHGSIVAQTLLKNQDERRNSFNTIVFGPELMFSVPRAFFPFSLFPFGKDMSPRTYLKTNLNYQSRPEDYKRTISSIDYGFSFKTNNNTLRHDIIPLEVYFVRAQLTNTFQKTLHDLNDAFLVNSFQDHATTLTSYAITYFSKESGSNSRKTVNYLRWSIQSSGSLLRKLFEMSKKEPDAQGRYLVFGIPFAHFVRTDMDYRIYIPVRKRSRIVYRVAGGIGWPLVNLSVLPYEQSFFSGGPNGVRAWRARTLGPGGYNQEKSGSTARFDKTGDILLEGNFEYRFHVIQSFYGALFVDAGNIWRLQPDEAKEHVKFLPDQFADQIAIGGGLGIRWDLDFFVVRVDMAFPLKDPRYEGMRWTFDDAPLRFTVLNFGIGYPF
jgi:outer membrane protein assembly factor BamA